MMYVYEVQQYYEGWLPSFVIASSVRVAMRHAKRIDYGGIRVIRRTINKTHSDHNHSKVMWDAFRGTDGKFKVYHSVPTKELR
jgi:hypothetical protein